MKMTLFFQAAFLAGALLPGPGLRGDPLIFVSKSAKASLIELYSSEGCSSCPPAEEWLNGLVTAPGLWRDIFPVAFHVDYWDDLGWPDRFATLAFTQRQRDYAARLGQNSVYTPEFLVDGREWRRNWLRDPLPAGMKSKEGTLTLTADASSSTFSVRYVPTSSRGGDNLVINVALLGFGVVSDVLRGENGGHQLRHDFLVLGFDSTRLRPDGTGAAASEPRKISPVAGTNPGAVAAWVSDANGNILQITGGWIDHAAPAH